MKKKLNPLRIQFLWKENYKSMRNLSWKDIFSIGEICYTRKMQGEYIQAIEQIL